MINPLAFSLYVLMLNKRQARPKTKKAKREYAHKTYKKSAQLKPIAEKLGCSVDEVKEMVMEARSGKSKSKNSWSWSAMKRLFK